MKHIKKRIIAVMALLNVAASFGGCNSANTAATIDPEVTSSEIVSSVPVSSEATSSEAASSAPVSSEEEKAESEAASSEAEVSSEPAVTSAPAAVSNPAATSQPVSSAASSAPVESVTQTSNAPPAQTASAPAQQSGSAKAFEDMTIEEQDQWLLDQLNEQLASMEVQEYGADGGNSAESTQPAEGVGDVYEAIRLINEERVKAGLNELEIDDTMMEMAAVRAKEATVVFDHVRPDGDAWWMVFDEFGSRAPSIGGENIGLGKPWPKTQVNSWMASTGHKANILKEGLTKIGVGYCAGDATSQYDSCWAMLVSE